MGMRDLAWAAFVWSALAWTGLVLLVLASGGVAWLTLDLAVLEKTDVELADFGKHGLIQAGSGLTGLG
jgi:hypothetical protein